MLNVKSSEVLSGYGNANPIFKHQGAGAMVVLVLMSIWASRRHLGDVMRKAFRGDADVDDSGEILSYRMAVFGLLIGTIVMCVWLWMSGLNIIVVLVLITAALMLYIGITKVIMQGGIPSIVPPTIASDVVISGLGSRLLGPVGLTSLAFTWVWGSDLRTFPMVPCAHGLKMGESMHVRKRFLFWAFMLAIVISLLTSFWFVIKLAYTHEGLNLNSWFFIGGAKWPFEMAVKKILHPTGPSLGGWITMGIGAGFMVLLTLMQRRFYWWPFHPVGFAVSSVWLMNALWLSIFLSWLLKTLILKYGGGKVYRKSVFFFLGMPLGQYVCAGVWFIIDILTGHTGNSIFWI